jgi:hypothetical protein
MLTELIVKSAIEAVVGQGFKAIVERVFSQARGKSDRQILEAVLLEVHRHGGAIGNVEFRLTQLEQEVSRLQHTAGSVVYSPVRAPMLPAPIPDWQTGAHFKRVSGGVMNFNTQRRKR